MMDPHVAASEAIAAYFADAVDGLVARRGWPEANVELDLTTPLLTVELAQGEPTWVSPTLLGRVDGRWMWRIAWLQITGQIDLWTAYRATLDEMAAAIQDVLHNRLPFQTGLFLTSDDYNGVRLEVSITTSKFTPNGDSAPKGEWRKTWDVSVSTYLVAFSDQAEASDIDLSGITVS